MIIVLCFVGVVHAIVILNHLTRIRALEARPASMETRRLPRPVAPPWP